MKLSKDFNVREFLFSETAARLGREIHASAEIVSSLGLLCHEILQPLRDAIATPIIITSGYRPSWLNKIIGGSINSQHIFGLAADCKAVGMSPKQLCEKVVEMNLRYDQVILEFDKWMHVSIPGDAPARQQVLTARYENQRTIYYPGLIEKRI